MSGTPHLADTFYPDRRRTSVDEGLFRRPTAIYRGAPFWAWNNRLNRKELLRQIAVFKKMGFGGFHMHVRSGLATPYLQKEFLSLVRACVNRADQINLKAWLYDEDRWPSGFGGGLVTRDPAHRAKYILFTKHPYSGIIRPTPNISCGQCGRLENGKLLARYAVRLRGAVLVGYQRLAEGEPAPTGMEEWFAYLETVGGTAWFNHQGYVDTLSPRAIERFTEVTHEKYRKAVGRFFGKTIPAIFTDEPQHLFKDAPAYGSEKSDLTLPATTDFFTTYQSAYKHDLCDRLPEVVWEQPDGRASFARYCYHDHVTMRFVDAYAGTLGRWSARHGLPLTGHMMEEQGLGSQTRAVGDVMRSLAQFQIPGIDMLCDRLEITTAKQAQSVVNQYDHPGVMSELYGVTGWNYDFVGHKAQGDWQAAMGVTIRVPHLAWGSMAGEAKRDYPASISDQSPWWKEYRLIEDHFARINVVMSRGRSLVRVGVIHPIESYWLSFGPLAETKRERERLEREFQELPEWLLGNLVDFDFLCEALLPEQASVSGRKFRVGAMSYEVIVVPALRTIRGTTVALLERFIRGGGQVVFAGAIPELVDAKPSVEPAHLAKKAIRAPWRGANIVRHLDSIREIDCVDPRGRRYGKVFHRWRIDGSERHLFMCHRDRKKASGPLELRVRGMWRFFIRDTLNGTVAEISAVREGDWSAAAISLQPHGHLLLTLRPGVSAVSPAPVAVWRKVGRVATPLSVSLSEPNVLLLDQPEWRWNEGPWRPREELLRINNLVRDICKLPLRDGNDAQPWTETTPAPTLGRVSLRFVIRSEVGVTSPELAIEDAESWTICWNARLIQKRPSGHWVDRALRRIALPSFRAGEHELIISRDFTRKTELEWAYLLGDFGVKLRGRYARLIPPVRMLKFGDWTKQGLPFYAGNVTYHTRFRSNTPGRHAFQFSRFNAPLLKVRIDGGKNEPVAFAPFRCEFLSGKSGWHRVEITSFGNRQNAFGPLHNRNPGFPWQIPQAWRSTGRHWGYDYHLDQMGVLVPPDVEFSGPIPPFGNARMFKRNNASFSASSAQISKAFSDVSEVKLQS